MNAHILEKKGNTMEFYTPRRASRRWLDGDCPVEVLAIFDHPKYGDRYTVFYRTIYGGEGRNGYIGGRGMSENPSHPQGIGMSFEMRPHEVANYRYAQKHHACQWSMLPTTVQDCVKRDVATA